MYEENESIGDMTKEILHLTQENNRMIKGMRRDAVIGGVLRIVLWLAVIVGSYYLTMQYLEPILSGMNAGDEGGINFQDLIKQYQSLQGE